jgi:hypothetical protein
VYNAAVWLRRVEDHLGEPLLVRWRSFPLEQVNSQDEGWVFWEQPPEEVKGLRAFLAAEAVRDQGEKIFREFVFALLAAVHERKLPVQEADTIREAARQVEGLDLERLERDMEQPSLRERIAQDYRAGVDEHGVFGTPTLLFPDGDAVFLKMTPPAPEDQAHSLFDTIQTLSEDRPYVQELKKPRRPEPSK